MEALRPMLADDVVWEVPGPDEIPFAGARRGPDEVARYVRERDEIVVYERFEVREIIAAEDRAVATGFYAGGAKTTSGLPFACEWAMVFRIRDGSIVECREYTDTAALAAAISGPAA